MKTLPLRRLARIVNGGTPTSDPENWDGDVLWVTPADLASVDGGVISCSQRSITGVGLHTGSAAIPPGGVIVSTRAPIGYICRTSSTTAFNQGARGLVPHNGVEVRFLQYALLSARPDLVAAGSGSTFQELSTEALASIRIPCPELDEQRRIADFLDDQVGRIGALLGLFDRQADLVTERFRCLEDEVLRALPGVPLRRLLADSCVGIVIQPAALYVWGEDEGVPAVRGTDVHPGWIDTSVPVRLSVAGHAANPRSHLRLGDVVIVRTGAAGTTAVVDETTVGWNAIDVLIARPSAAIIPEYLELALNWLSAGEGVAAASAGAIQGHFGVGALRDLRVPFADVDVQRRMVGQLHELRTTTTATLATIDVQRQLLKEKKAALISSAVAGQLDVSTAPWRSLAGVGQ